MNAFNRKKKKNFLPITIKQEPNIPPEGVQLDNERRKTLA